MSKSAIHNLKLGIFLIAGLAFLVLLLYMIGKNQNFFGKTFLLKARFENVNGLMTGNNVRLGGIDAGTVKEINMINDTTIEVSMQIRTKMKNYIHTNALVSIATDGLMGNKLINIEAKKEMAPVVNEGDILNSERSTSMDEMLKVLDRTNNDISVIASELKVSVKRFNNSSAFWELLNDKRISGSLRESLLNVKKASEKINTAMTGVQMLVNDVESGKGSVGMLLKDSTFALQLNETLCKIKGVGNHADTIALNINKLVESLTYQIEQGKGSVNALLKDSSITLKLGTTLNNIEKGTAAFNDNMEAIKSSFLFRGYFKKLEKQKQQAKSSKKLY